MTHLIPALCDLRLSLCWSQFYLHRKKEVPEELLTTQAPKR